MSAVNDAAEFDSTVETPMDSSGKVIAAGALRKPPRVAMPKLTLK